MHKNAMKICQHLDEIAAKGYNFSRVYDDFLSLTTNALCKQEEEYLRVMGTYRNDAEHGKREGDYFAAAFAQWQMALSEDYRDYLGEIYEERVSLGEKGQFFTPESLADMMAELMMPSQLADGARVSDPACGSGRMLLKASRMNRNGYFHGIDLDLRCVRMTALNLLCRNVDGAVVWGNALSLKAFGGYELRKTPLGGVMEWFGENRATELIRMGLISAPEPIKQEEQPAQEPQYSLAL